VSVPRLSILVVSYNTRELTLACLRSVFEQTRVNGFELIVLDNASADGSADAIEAEFGARVRLIRSAENLGFARGNNEAAKLSRGELLLLLNPDTVVLDGAIDKLVLFAERRSEAMIWGGRTVFADGSLNPASCWGRQTLWSVLCVTTGLSSAFARSALFNPEAYGGWDRSTQREVDIVSGCYLLIGRTLWERLGGFDPAFFMYGEEADLCLRARALGARPAVTPDSTIVHLGGASEKVRSDKVVRLLKAKSLLIRRHWPAWRAAIGVRVLSLWPFSRAMAWKVVGAVRPSERGTAMGRAWLEVWQRRREWIEVARSAGAC
jgi:GT2 family glycosyltransferase